MSIPRAQITEARPLAFSPPLSHQGLEASVYDNSRVSLCVRTLVGIGLII